MAYTGHPESTGNRRLRLRITFNRRGSIRHVLIFVEQAVLIYLREAIPSRQSLRIAMPR